MNAVTTVTAYQSQHSVSLDGVVQPGEWNDTPWLKDPTSTITVAFKQNGTGLLILMIWQEPSQCTTCYAALELGNLSNTGHMGSPTTPTIMIIVSPSYKGYVDEAISTGESTPIPVEQYGYRTQSVAGLGYADGMYTAEIYRPFKLVNASPYDFNLTVGSTIELGLALGDFSIPGSHQATDMSTYVLTISDQVYTPSTTSTTSATTTSATTGSGQNILAGVPGLNLNTLYVTAAIALVFGLLLGVGVALKSRNMTTGS